MKKIWFDIKDWLRSTLFKSPALIEWTINVQTVQKFGHYDLLITDDANRSYSLGIGPLICGDIRVPKGKWIDAMSTIQPGTILKVRIRSEELVDARSQAIIILKVLSLMNGR